MGHRTLLLLLLSIATLSYALNATLLHNATVYTTHTPTPTALLILGANIHSLIYNRNHIPSILEALKKAQIVVQVIDTQGAIIVPGFIDVHVHVAGGGGEMGYSSQTPQAKLSELINAGITTIIGITGTDSITRSLEHLYARVKAIQSEGLNAYMWTGAYHVPVPTITESVMKDIMLIDPIIGVGELAISDHRSSWPTYDELVRIVSDARVGGMLAGKCGKVHFHLGKASSKLDLLWQIVSSTTIPITQMYPTHMTSRGPELLAEAKKWILAGGTCDFTADTSGNKTIEALLALQNEKLPLSHITVSSDSYGSLPIFDAFGNLKSYNVSKPDVLLRTFRHLVLDHGWSIENAMQFFTSNPAHFLGFKDKGEISVDMRGDVLVLESSSLELKYVFASGVMMKCPGWVKRGMFE